MTVWVVIYEPECKPWGVYLTEDEANSACEGIGYATYYSVQLLTTKKITVE
jgi:hypothetical protein